MAETLVKKPRLIDFFEDGDFSKDIDILSFVKAKREFDQQLHSSTIVADNLEKKHPFRNRKVYPKRDPTTSTWWRDYVVNGKFGDPNHRDGKLFELRFFYLWLISRNITFGKQRKMHLEDLRIH